ncbi:hypothetical protein ACOMHN_066801 [Nucella lapillus]
MWAYHTQPSCKGCLTTQPHQEPNKSEEKESVTAGVLDVTQDVSPHSAVYRQFISQVLSPYTSASSCASDYEVTKFFVHF